MAGMVIHLIERKTGSLDPGIHERIRTLSMDQVRRLGEAIGDVKNAEDISDWLTSNA